MPKYEQLQVRRGDFGSKYQLIEEGDARNRELNERKLRSIAQRWQDASKDTVTLVRNEDSFLIADGQHRIAAASQYFEDEVTIHAMVWERDEVRDLADFITAFNRGTAFSTAHLFQVYSNRSPWVKAAEKRDMPFVLSRYRHTRYSWTSSMRAVANADRWRDRGTFVSKPVGREELTFNFWLDYPEEGIEEVLDALEWWHPVAVTAYRSMQRSGKLFGEVPSAVAISLYRKYRTRPAFLRDARERFLASNQMVLLHNLDAGQVRWFAQAMLAGFNYRVSKDFMELHGETGRD